MSESTHQTFSSTSPICHQQWPITHFSDYRTRPDGSIEYLVQWQSTELTLPQLCENLDGQPLQGHASSLEPHQQAGGYLVKWKPSWTPLEELFHRKHLHGLVVAPCQPDRRVLAARRDQYRSVATLGEVGR
jgi:hypothetical protein